MFLQVPLPLYFRDISFLYDALVETKKDKGTAISSNVKRDGLTSGKTDNISEQGKSTVVVSVELLYHLAKSPPTYLEASITPLPLLNKEYYSGLQIICTYPCYCHSKSKIRVP